MYTQRPDLEGIEGYAQQILQDNNGSNTQLGVSLPIVEGVFGARLSGVYDQNDGQETSNITTGQEEEYETTSGRISLLWLPTEDLDVAFVYQYQELEADWPQAIEGTPDELTALRPDLVLFTPDKEDRLAIHQGDTQSVNETELFNLKLDWVVAGHSLTSISAYKEFSEERVSYTRDLTGVEAYPSPGAISNPVETFSQEVRLSNIEGAFDGLWEYILGIHYVDSDFTPTVISDFSSQFAGVDVGALVSVVDVDFFIETSSIFLNNKFNLADNFNIQIGVRYQEIEVENQVYSKFWVNPPLAPEPFLASDSELISPENVLQEEEVSTGGIKASYFFGEDNMLFVAWDRSFRPGGVNILTEAVPESDLLYDSEDSDNFEIGIKSTMLDDRLRLNGSIYYQVYNGLQAYGVDPSFDAGEGEGPQLISGTMVYNADATVKGAEFEMQAILNDRWSMASNAAYTDGTFDDGETGLCNETAQQGAVARCNVGGESTNNQPKWTFTINSEYFIPIASGEWYFRGMLSWRSEKESERIEEKVPDYALLDLYTGYRAANGRWDVSLWSKNVTDEQEKIGPRGELRVSSGDEIYQSDYRSNRMIDPRRVGVTLRYNFGG